MPVFKDPPVAITIPSAGSWQTIDLSAELSSSASGVILAATNSSAADRQVGFRKNGSTTSHQHDLDGDSRSTFFCGCDGTQKIQIYVESVTSVAVELVGYFEGEAVFFTNPPQVSTSAGANTFQEIDLSGQTGADTAVAALLYSRPDGAISVAARRAGSSDDFRGLKDNLFHYAIGLDGNERLEWYRAASPTSEKLYLSGYMLGAASFPAAATNVSPGSLNVWTEVQLSAAAAGAVLLVSQGNSDVWVRWGARKKGSAVDSAYGTSEGLSLVVVEADGAQKIEIINRSEDLADISFYLLGEILSAVTLPAAAAERVREAAAPAFTINNDFSVPMSGAERVREADAPALGLTGPKSQRQGVEEITAVVLTGYDSDLVADIAAPPWPVGLEQIPTEALDFEVAGGQRSIYLADAAYTSFPTDTPANQPFAARIKADGGYSFAVRAFSGSRPEGRASEGAGELRLSNGDGALDYLIDLGLAGRVVEVYSGFSDERFTQFKKVFVGTVDALAWRDDTITLDLRDRQVIFDRPIQTRFYAGTGGEEGDASLAGKPRPLALGEVFNIEPPLVEAALLTYQIHDGPIESLVAVRDRGAALTDSGQAPASYAALVALTTGAGQDIEPGEYALCNTSAGAWLRLAAAPDGRITCDALGDNVGGYVAAHAEIVRRLVETRMLVSQIGVDAPAFDQAAADQAAPAGWWSGPEAQNFGQALTDIMAAAGGWWAFTPLGDLTVGILQEPATAKATLDKTRLGSGRRPTRTGTRPAWRWRVGYEPLGVVQDADSLAGSLTAAQRQFYSTPQRLAEAVDEFVRTKFVLAEDLEPLALWASADGASAEAERLLALHGQRRDVYEVQVLGLTEPLWLGDTVTLDLTDVDGARYNTPRDFVIIGIEQRARFRDQRLILWG